MIVNCIIITVCVTAVTQSQMIWTGSAFGKFAIFH